MRTCLFTGFNAAYAPLADLTVPLMRDYASRHDYGFDCYQTYSLPVNYLPLDIPNRIYWTGVAGALAKLGSGDYNRVIYLDVDQVITNPDIPLDVPRIGFHISRDWGADATEPWHVSMCGFMAHRDAVPIFRECLSMEPEWRDKPFPEQGPMRELIRRKPGSLLTVGKSAEDNVEGALFNIHPRRFLNAVPKEVHESVQEPWRPGDFAAHLTNLPLDKRIELFHEIKKQAGI